MPEPPAWLPPLAKQEWSRVMPDLFMTGIYQASDESMLAAYCMAFYHWCEAEQDFAKMAAMDGVTHARMMRTTNGNAIQNPMVGIISTTRRDLERLASHFGLTPSARVGIAGGGKPDDPVAGKYGL